MATVAIGGSGGDGVLKKSYEPLVRGVDGRSMSNDPIRAATTRVMCVEGRRTAGGRWCAAIFRLRMYFRFDNSISAPAQCDLSEVRDPGKNNSRRLRRVSSTLHRPAENKKEKERETEKETKKGRRKKRNKGLTAFHRPPWYPFIYASNARAHPRRAE